MDLFWRSVKNLHDRFGISPFTQSEAREFLNTSEAEIKELIEIASVGGTIEVCGASEISTEDNTIHFKGLLFFRLREMMLPNFDKMEE